MSNWKKVKLSSVVEIIGGGTPKTSNPEYWDGIIPWLSVVDFGGDRKYVNDTERKITEKGLHESSTKILKEGQLIISARGTVGELAVLKRDMAFNQSCYGLNAASGLATNDFIYYLIKYELASLKSKAHGSVFDTITRQTFDQLEVNLPDLPTQTRIASILSALDNKIELNRQMNHTLEQMAQALFKKYFVEDIDPENLPEGWNLGNLGDMVSVQNGYAFKGSDFKEEGVIGIIKIRNIGNNVVDVLDTQFVDSGTIDGLDRKFEIRTGNVLIAMTGAEVGKIGIVPDTQKQLWLNQRVGNFMEKFSGSLYYSYLLLSSPQYQELLQNTAMGSAQPNISGTDIENIACIFPPINQIQRFGEIVKPMFDQIIKNLGQNMSLNELRDSLLPKLMSGEIEIKEAESILA